MPRDGSGIYSKPFPDVVDGTTIESAVYNGFVNDVAQDLNAARPVTAGGTGANSADQALFNLAAEKAAQTVTSYDSHLWVPGSFRSAVGTPGAPNATATFSGVCYINEALANPPTNANVTVEARDSVDGMVYVRAKVAGVWSAWKSDRTAIYAAPFDAMSFNGMQINGAMGISQESGLNVVTIPPAGNYVVDGFVVGKNTSATITAQQTIGGVIGSGFYRAAMFVTAATAMTSGAGDYVFIVQKIEGMRVAKLGWGNAIAQPVTVAFWIRATAAGHASLAVVNAANNRSYTADIVIAGGNVWEYKTITVPGDITGVWPRDNVTGIQLLWTLAAGATLQTAPNAWTAGNFSATTAQTNLLSTIGNQVFLTGVKVLPGTEAPTAERSSFIERPADYELILCSRYLQLVAVGGGYFPVSGLTNSATALIPMLNNMRISPTVYLPWGDSNYSSAVSATTWAFALPGLTNLSKTGTLTATGFASQPGIANAIFYGATISGASTAINSGVSIVPIKLDARL